MKNLSITGLLPFLLITCGGSEHSRRPAPPPSGPLSIDIPGPTESVFAEMRDFYVRGTFPPDTTKPGDVLIQVYRGDFPVGIPVRQVLSQVDPSTGTTPATSLFDSYANGIAWGGIDATQVPDLIAIPGSLYNPSNKVMVTNTWYAGVILGGCTKAFDTTYTDRGWNPLRELLAGTYTIAVTGVNGGIEGLRGTRQIRFGMVPKLFGRFSPAAHLAKLQAYASAHQLRVFNDPFPGYFKANPAAASTYEIPARWRPNNAIEVVNDLPGATTGTAADAVSTFILYNIKATSTTQQLELGTLLKHGLSGSPRVSYLRYDTGEPILVYRNPAQEAITLEGNLVSFEPGLHLVLTRAEGHAAGSDPAASQENLWNAADPTPKELDLDFSDGVQVKPDQVLDLCGVVKPIPTDVTAVDGLPCAYTALNRIAQIRYTFLQGDTVASTAVKNIQLGRLYPGSSTPTTSVYEFLHRFETLPAPGVYTVALQCLDAGGLLVEGGTASFTLRVAP